MLTINRFSLANGLRVVHCEDKQVPMVVLNTIYDVGSKDEVRTQTGFAHLFEHLMFGGTPEVPSYDEPVQMAGGEDNAWTCCDFTNYYITVPAINAEMAFWIEADRMKGLAFTQKSLDVQRSVVCEEFKQRCINKPYGDLSHYRCDLCFGKSHPYGWPTIGLELSHIEQATMDDVKRFFYSHYAPNNAILAVVGNITLDEVKRLTEKYYAEIPMQTIAQRNIPKLPIQTAPRRLEVEKDVPTSMYYRFYHTGGRLSGDYYVTDFLSDVLANGASSRMKQRLVKEKKVFTSANACISGEIEEGLFYLKGQFADGTTAAMADEAFDEMIEELKTDLVPEREAVKLQNKYEVRRLFHRMKKIDLASDLAYFELLGDVYEIDRKVEQYKAVTPDEARNYARRVFTKENSCTLYYKAKK